MRAIRRVLQDLLDELEVAHDEAGLTAAANRTARRLGFRWFAYLASTEPEATIISSYPRAWVRHYQAEQFERIDPVVSPALWPRWSFFWSGDDDWRTPEQRRLFGEAKAFQIYCGVTVPIRDGGDRFAAFTLAADEHSDEFRRYATEAIDILHLMGLYFHAHVYAKRRLGLGHISDASLTPRERQCLAWSARGKTMADTAQILGVTKRTVEFHLDNARSKLSASTLSQAVAEAVKRGLLPPK